MRICCIFKHSFALWRIHMHLHACRTVVDECIQRHLNARNVHAFECACMQTTTWMRMNAFHCECVVWMHYECIWMHTVKNVSMCECSAKGECKKMCLECMFTSECTANMCECIFWWMQEMQMQCILKKCKKRHKNVPLCVWGRNHTHSGKKPHLSRDRDGW